jgi:carboxyl-terminal processing protease
MSCAPGSWTFYDLYNLAQKRRFERYQYALKVLERPMDFTGNDNFNLDRSKRRRKTRPS